jgi:hypothetical protein
MVLPLSALPSLLEAYVSQEKSVLGRVRALAA